MSFNLFDAILDPVIVVDDSTNIQYLNPSAIRWLALPSDTVFFGRPYGDFIHLDDVKSLHGLRELGPYGFNAYCPTAFKLRSGYQGTIKLGVQKIPVGDEIYWFAILIHDLVYAQALYSDDLMNFSRFNPPLDTPVDHDEKTVRAHVPTQRIAPIETKVVMTVVNPKVAPPTYAHRISEEWLEVLVHATGFQAGLECQLEFPDTPHLRGFSCSVTVESVRTDSSSAERLRLKFGNLTTLAKSAISDYLSKFGVSI